MAGEHVSILLSTHAETHLQVEAVAALLTCIENAGDSVDAVGAARFDLLGPLLALLRDAPEGSTRLQISHLLSLLLGSPVRRGPRGHRFECFRERDETRIETRVGEEEGNTRVEEVIASPKPRHQTNHFFNKEKRRRRPPRRMIGSLSGIITDSNGSVLPKISVGFEIPMIWIPSNLLKPPPPPAKNTSNEVKKLTKQKCFVRSKRNSSELEHLVKDEHEIWLEIDECIRKGKRDLPTRFLLEYGLEVAYARELARRVLDCLVRFAGREPTRRPFRIWHEWTLEMRFQELLRFTGGEKMKIIGARLVKASQRKAFSKWIQYLECSRETESTDAALVIQSCRRRVLASRRAKEMRMKHKFAGIAQAIVRMVHARWNFARKRLAAMELQSVLRMWAAKSKYKKSRSAIVCLQARYRGLVETRQWKRIRMSSIQIQSHWRGALSRMLLPKMKLATATRESQRQRSAEQMQRCWYRHLAFKEVRSINERISLCERSALSVQRAWYKHTEQFSAFVLMRCYLVKEHLELLRQKLERKALRAKMATQIQAWIRMIYAKLLLKTLRVQYHAARRSQSLIRGFVARRKVFRFKIVVSFIKRIQRFCRACFTFSSLQKADESQILRKVATLQAFARMISARIYLQKMRATPVLQRLFRGHLSRERVKCRKAKINHHACMLAVNRLIQTVAVPQISFKLFTHRTRAATIVQGWIRSKFAKERIKFLRAWHCRRVEACRILQPIIRGMQWRKTLFIENESCRRATGNRFNHLESPEEIVSLARKHASSFYNYEDECAGVHPIEWLRRHGLGPEIWEALHRSKLKIDTVAMLKQVPKPALSKILDGTALLALQDALKDSHSKRLPVFIRRKKTFQMLFLDYFPKEINRAEGFAEFMPLNEITEPQLQKYFEKYSGRPKEAKANAKSELLDQQYVGMEACHEWEEVRYRKCAKIYAQAVERILYLPLAESIQMVAKQSLTRSKLPGNHGTRRACNELLVALSMLENFGRAARVIQRHVRGKASRALVFVAKAKQIYNNKNETVLYQKWLRQREEDKRELEAYKTAIRRYQIEMELAQITRAGFLEIWDEYSQTHFYMDETKESLRWDRPIYTIDEFSASNKIQNNSRKWLAKLRVEKLRRQAKIEKKEAIEREIWKSSEQERLNHVSVRFNFELIEDEVRAEKFFISWRSGNNPSWIERFEPLRNSFQEAEANSKSARSKVEALVEKLSNIRTRIPKQALRSTEDLRAMELADLESQQVERFYLAKENLGHLASFHSSSIEAEKEIEQLAATRIASLFRMRVGNLIAEERRIASLHAKASLEVACCDNAMRIVGEKYANLVVGTRVSIHFTFVDMPFGWKTMKEGYGRTYFVNELTFETAWDRPSFTFEEQQAAKVICRVLRGFHGRKKFMKDLREEGIRATALRGVEEATSVACLETTQGPLGLTVQQWFARRGLHEILEEVLKATDERDQKRLRRRFQAHRSRFVSPWTAKALDAISVRRQAHIELVLEGEQNHENLDFAFSIDEVADLFLKSFPKQRARAFKFAEVVVYSETPVTMRQLELHLRKYAGKPSLALVQLAEEVLHLPTVSEKSDRERAFHVLQSAARRICIIASNMKIPSLKEQVNVIVDEASTIFHAGKFGKDKYTFVKPMLCKNPLQNDIAATVRIFDAFTLVWQWEDSCAKIQRHFRGYRRLQHWRRTAACFRGKATIIQSVFRRYSARMLRRLRFRQFHSSWEELFDPNFDRTYYFNNETQKAQWQPPLVPFRPLNWWPLHPDDMPVPEGFCCICREDLAIRVCHQCLTKRGENKAFCLYCFADAHTIGGLDFAGHSFSALTAELSLTCGQCHAKANVRCSVCADLFCNPCFLRLHSKGSRSKHAVTRFSDDAVGCVECARAVAERFCETCKEHLCSPCAEKLHRKGQRTKHKLRQYPF